MSANTTARKQTGRPFQPGVSGNPAGRPKGARNKYAQAVIDDCAQEWNEKKAGFFALLESENEKTKLGAWREVIKVLVPHQVDLSMDASPLSDWSDERVKMLVRAADRWLEENADEANEEPPRYDA